MDNSSSRLIPKTIHSLIHKKQGVIHRAIVLDYHPAWQMILYGSPRWFLV